MQFALILAVIVFSAACRAYMWADTCRTHKEESERRCPPEPILVIKPRTD